MYNDKFLNRYIKKCGSRYAATLYVADKARQLVEQYNHVIDIAEAISWLLSGVTPYNIANYDEIMRQREQRSLWRAQESLALISDVNVRESVLESLIRSRRAHHLIYWYEGIYEEHQQARVRILTRKLWDEIHELNS